MPFSILNCNFLHKEIIKKIYYSQSKKFQKKLNKVKNPLEKKNTIEIIINNLSKIDQVSIMKQFNDIR